MLAKLSSLCRAPGKRVYDSLHQCKHCNSLAAKLSDMIDEVRTSVAAGKEVIIHESPTTADGWSCAGDVVVDPEVGGCLPY